MLENSSCLCEPPDLGFPHFQETGLKIVPRPGFQSLLRPVTASEGNFLGLSLQSFFHLPFHI